MRISPRDLRAVFVAEHDLANPHKYRALFRLPRLERLGHRLVRRHVVAFGAGAGLMIVGSALASHSHDQQLVPAPTWDAVAYLIHAVGAVPVLRHLDPIWTLLTREV